jgi:hypothetical protein
MAFFGDSKKCVFSDNSTCKNQHMQKSAHAKISTCKNLKTNALHNNQNGFEQTVGLVIYTGFILNLDLIFFFQNTTVHTQQIQKVV